MNKKSEEPSGIPSDGLGGQIGEKLKLLRKERGLTQSDLAGEQLTKSMLSQIENGKAMPSMKSLAYLAMKLGKDPSYFLEAEAPEGLADLVREMEAAVKRKEYEQVWEKAGKALSAGMPPTVNAARLMEAYVSACYYTGRERNGKEMLDRAVEIYDRFGLHAESAKAQYMEYALLFAEGKYAESLALTRKVRAGYEARTVGKDVVFELDLLYAESVSLSATGDYEKSRELLLNALTLSGEEDVYHYCDHFLRVLAGLEMILGRLDAAKAALKRARKYVEFTENPISEGYLILTEARLHTEAGDYEQALQLAEEAVRVRHVRDGSYWLIRGIALFYLNRDEDAFDALSRISTPEGAHHPMERTRIYASYSYRAVICERQGKTEEARELAAIAHDRVKSYPPSPSKTFITEVYDRLH